MAGFKTIDVNVSNPHLAGLLTATPFNVLKPVGWDNSAPLKYFFDNTGIRAWSATEKAAILQGFASWSKVANIDFVETATRAEADMIPVLNNSTQNLGSVSSLPDQGLHPITINFSIANGAFDDLGFGGDSFETVIHEIGHALGLNHPHDGTLFPGVPDGGEQNTGDNALNQQIWTVLSYAVGWTGEPVTTSQYGTAGAPMAFDIAAAQILYGQRAANTDNTTYVIDTTNDVGTGWAGIWDTGGIDTISAGNSTSAVTIDLREAPLTGANAGGYVSWQAGVKGGFVVANGVTIENAIGGSANDIITGNGVANTIDGGAGIDTSMYSGEAKNFTVKITKGAATSVQDRKGTEGTDSLTNIEKLDFTGAKDVDLSILNGVANVTSADLSFFIEMYIAYFNRAPDAEGLFFWGTRLSEGMSLQDIAKTFFALDEAVSVYGGKSNSELVDTVYQNFLGREAEAAGKDFWTGELDSGSVQKGAFLLAIINGAKSPTSLPSDANYIKNKADIGAYFSVIKGMGNADNAKAAMALYDGTDTSKTAAKSAIDGYYNTASQADGGELLIQLVGVMNDPFAIA